MSTDTQYPGPSRGKSVIEPTRFFLVIVQKGGLDYLPPLMSKLAYVICEWPLSETAYVPPTQHVNLSKSLINPLFLLHGILVAYTTSSLAAGSCKSRNKDHTLIHPTDGRPLGHTVQCTLLPYRRKPV